MTSSEYIHSKQVKKVTKHRLQEYLENYYNNNKKTKIPFNYDQELTQIWSELVDFHRKYCNASYEVLES